MDSSDNTEKNPIYVLQWFFGGLHVGMLELSWGTIMDIRLGESRIFPKGPSDKFPAVGLRWENDKVTLLGGETNIRGDNLIGRKPITGIINIIVEPVENKIQATKPEGAAIFCDHAFLRVCKATITNYGSLIIGDPISPDQAWTQKLSNMEICYIP